MKAKELIKILEGVDPESEVAFGIGRYGDGEYRRRCAKAELMLGECLDYLVIDYVAIHKNDCDNEPWANIILEQSNVGSLSDVARDFDEKYQIKEG